METYCGLMGERQKKKGRKEGKKENKGGRREGGKKKGEGWERTETESFIQMKSSMTILKNDKSITALVKWG